MSGLKQKIKLFLFRVLRRSYKKKLLHGSLAEPEFILLQAFLKQRPLTFIDVGANKGEFLYMAEKVLPPSRIWAFEPLPWFARKLRALFPGTHIFNVGLSDQASKTFLYVPRPGGVPDDSLASLTEPAGGDFDKYEIEIATLDTVVKEDQISGPAFLKIDVEGHEFAVLKGGEYFIRHQVELMMLEIEERHHPGKKLAEMIASVEEMGFIAYYLDPTKKQLVRFSDYPHITQENKHLNTPFYINNFWFFAKQTSYTDVVATLNQTPL
jgi:FkbM family methyltransferase